MLALLFPGQGSQEVGMGRDAAEASPAARQVFALADDVLGFALSRLCFDGPEEQLRRTELQQPAILATSIALLRALEERGAVTAAFVAGHSLGEYTALVASGALELEDALRLVQTRGRYMQEAVAEGKGAMAAILGCAPEVVERACERARAATGRVVAPANYNGPQQTVIAGETLAVEMACARAREAGARRAVLLPVSAPFHCPLMLPAAEKLWPELASTRFRPPSPPVVTNVEATPNADAARIPSLLRSQVTEPVRFTEMVLALRERGVSHVLEIGPGRVLSGLVARVAPGIARASLGGAPELDAAVGFLARAA
jgi:[acyl-carrier-protein] S-malonyltransferase